MLKQAVCTIITKNYLAFARALSYTLRKHNPDCGLYVLLADRIDGYFDPKQEPFTTICLDDLPAQEQIKQMSFYYTAFEFCCALRGLLHEYFYNQKIAQKWIFLDSDILIYNSFDEIFSQLEQTSILLNAHLDKPINQPDVNNIEPSILVSGLYNAGFIGLRRCNETEKFIAWFKDRLINYCFNRRGKGISSLLFVDQLWLNYVPHFFKDVSFLVHPGANVAYWSLSSKQLIRRGECYFIDNKPLLFIHFTGWNINHPLRISRYLSSSINDLIWKELGDSYKKLLLRFGYEETIRFPYAFNSFSNGQEITPEMRYLYYENLAQNDVFGTNPFANNQYFNKSLGAKWTSSLSRNFLKKPFSSLYKLFT